MVKKHLKRLVMPKSWQIKRRGITFVTRPTPGPHLFKLCLPLNLLIRDILKITNNTRETKIILNNKNVLVDGIRRKEHKFPVGVIDVIEFKESKQYFRVILTEKGRITAIAIKKDEAAIKPCKIIGKTKVKGIMQLNLYDGKNILVEKDDYKVGDTVLITLPKQEIKNHFKLEKGCFIYLIGGKHSGETGRVEDIIANKIVYKTRKGETIETLKKYVFVLGKDKAIISIRQE